jgi:D-tyrosyl-tRNA(Tyr) deacylase
LKAFFKYKRYQWGGWLTLRAVIQRVNDAEVLVDGHSIAKIKKGILTYLAFEVRDHPDYIDEFIEKILNLRLFPNTEGKLDLSVRSIQGEVLLVSQFTLMANCNKGNRPSFSAAAPTEIARTLYNEAVKILTNKGIACCFGEFQADMEILSRNVGPVTLILDSAKGNP